MSFSMGHYYDIKNMVRSNRRGSLSVEGESDGLGGYTATWYYRGRRKTFGYASVDSVQSWVDQIDREELTSDLRDSIGKLQETSGYLRRQGAIICQKKAKELSLDRERAKGAKDREVSSLGPLKELERAYWTTRDRLCRAMDDDIGEKESKLKSLMAERDRVSKDLEKDLYGPLPGDASGLQRRADALNAGNKRLQDILQKIADLSTSTSTSVRKMGEIDRKAREAASFASEAERQIASNPAFDDNEREALREGLSRVASFDGARKSIDSVKSAVVAQARDRLYREGVAKGRQANEALIRAAESTLSSVDRQYEADTLVDHLEEYEKQYHETMASLSRIDEVSKDLDGKYEAIFAQVEKTKIPAAPSAGECRDLHALRLEVDDFIKTNQEHLRLEREFRDRMAALMAFYEPEDGDLPEYDYLDAKNGFRVFESIASKIRRKAYIRRAERIVATTRAAFERDGYTKLLFQSGQVNGTAYNRYLFVDKEHPYVGKLVTVVGETVIVETVAIVTKDRNGTCHYLKDDEKTLERLNATCSQEEGEKTTNLQETSYFQLNEVQSETYEGILAPGEEENGRSMVGQDLDLEESQEGTKAMERLRWYSMAQAMRAVSI